MLTSLLGSKSAERILLFLWVNEWCYVGQIQKAYGVPLTPLQSMMRKFEQAGIAMAEAQGKKKLYRLNPHYPFYAELQSLLQKGFAHLPASEKKRFFAFSEPRSARSYRHQKRAALCLQTFWERMARVQQVTIRAQTGEEAVGEVKVKEERAGVLLFAERGQWVKGARQGIDFSNTLRWAFAFAEGLVALEHLRHGPNHPIFLFHLAPIGARSFQSIDSHLCQGDCYAGRVAFNEQSIYLTWRILGSVKNETLQCIYV